MRKSLKLSWHAFMDYFIVQSPVRACFDIFFSSSFGLYFVLTEVLLWKTFEDCWLHRLNSIVIFLKWLKYHINTVNP